LKVTLYKSPPFPLIDFFFFSNSCSWRSSVPLPALPLFLFSRDFLIRNGMCQISCCSRLSSLLMVFLLFPNEGILMGSPPFFPPSIFGSFHRKWTFLGLDVTKGPLTFPSCRRAPLIPIFFFPCRFSPSFIIFSTDSQWTVMFLLVFFFSTFFFPARRLRASFSGRDPDCRSSKRRATLPFSRDKVYFNDPRTASYAPIRGSRTLSRRSVRQTGQSHTLLSPCSLTYLRDLSF